MSTVQEKKEPNLGSGEIADMEAEIPLSGDETGAPALPRDEAGLDSLVNTVLDAAGVANRSASLAAQSTENLLSAVGDVTRITKQAQFIDMVVLGVTTSLMLGALGAFLWVTGELQNRLINTDATLLAVGKRMVDMNVSVSSLKHMEAKLGEIGQAKPPEPVNLAPLEKKIDDAVAQLRKPAPPAPPPPPEKNAKQEEARHQALLASIRTLETQGQAQAKTIARLTEQLSATRSEIAALSGVARSLDSQLKSLAAARQAAAAKAPAPAVEKSEDKRPRDFIQYPEPATK